MIRLRPMLCRRRFVAVLLVWLCVVLPGAGVAGRDPGLVIEIDRSRYEVRLRDERGGLDGPRVRVVLGSPARATPTGEHRAGRVILNPAWRPSDEALAAGARPLPPSLDGPMGVAKIPFADGGSVALHGGGDRLLLGKPVSGGCVRARDADLLRIIAWLEERAALRPPTNENGGEVHRSFARPVRVRIR